MCDFDLSSSLKVLGANGGKKRGMELTSIQVSKSIVIDAGNIIDGLGDNILNVNHIFITHTHLDHILDIGFLIDSTFDSRKEPLKVYGSKGSIENIKKHIFNWDIWPDFTTINLPDSSLKSLIFVELELNEQITVDNYTLKVIPNNHTKTSNGYVITKNNRSILLSSDTSVCSSIWDEVNTNSKISSVIIDVSFPSSMEQLAFDSKHLTPKLLKNELSLLNREDVSIYISHIKPSFYEEVKNEIILLELLKNNGTIVTTNEIINF